MTIKYVQPKDIVYRTWHQYIALCYDHEFSHQEAKAWYSKLQKFDKSISQLFVGLSKALDKDDMKLYMKLLDKVIDEEDKRHRHTVENI